MPVPRRAAKTRSWVLPMLLAFSCPPAARSVAGAQAAAARHSGVLLDVPYFRQSRPNACGAASLAMLVRYWAKQMGTHNGASPSEEAIDRKLDPRDRGITNTAMAKYLRASGFRVFVFSGRWSDLRENLAKGRPLIVALGPHGQRGPYHYVVVAGMDWRSNLVFLNDPAQRKLFPMDRGRFLHEWAAAGNWTLLAVPKVTV